MSPAEQDLVRRSMQAPETSPLAREQTAGLIRQGADPLGDRLCNVRPADVRRTSGAFYTPRAIVDPMVTWVLGRKPGRLVDPGCGSGRFATAALRLDPKLEIVAIDLDPVATILTRAVLAVLGCRDATVLQTDYTTVKLPGSAGRTAFIGNPPYVRHHDLPPSAKSWIITTGKQLGHRASGLAGLHAHFFVATAVMATDGDVGCFVTSSEWLDVRYGSVVRHLLVNGLGGQSLHLVNPTAAAFNDAQTTAVITCFEKGTRNRRLTINVVQRTSELDLEGGDAVQRERFAGSNRWTEILRSVASPMVEGMVPLGQIARVSRGAVTGGNSFFVMTRERARQLRIEEWCSPAITDAREILDADGVVHDHPGRKVVLNLPRDLGRDRHPLLDTYLKTGETAADGDVPLAMRYICAHRTPWWCLGRQEPPPVVASYMARRPPAFALNPDRLLVINIAHCIYPRRAMSREQLHSLVSELNRARASFRGKGRTYQGGLEKFEPREMEALLLRLS